MKEDDERTERRSLRLLRPPMASPWIRREPTSSFLSHQERNEEEKEWNQHWQEQEVEKEKEKERRWREKVENEKWESGDWFL